VPVGGGPVGGGRICLIPRQLTRPPPHRGRYTEQRAKLTRGRKGGVVVPEKAWNRTLIGGPNCRMECACLWSVRTGKAAVLKNCAEALEISRGAVCRIGGRNKTILKERQKPAGRRKANSTHEKKGSLGGKGVIREKKKDLVSQITRTKNVGYSEAGGGNTSIRTKGLMPGEISTKFTRAAARWRYQSSRKKRGRGRKSVVIIFDGHRKIYHLGGRKERKKK